jgi:hypothetical protein
MDIQELKCAEKIASELKDREEYLSDLYAVIDSDTAEEEEQDNAREEIQEMAYGIDTRTISRVIWSGGGPADYLEITRNELGEILLVEYLYEDWYDGAKLIVSEDSPAYRYALEL